MPDISVEEAVNQNCEALLSGDVMRVANDFTVEALNAVMSSASGMMTIPSLLGYQVLSHDTEGEDHHFLLAFQTSDGEYRARATWRDIDGLWKVTALTIEPPASSQPS